MTPSHMFRSLLYVVCASAMAPAFVVATAQGDSARAPASRKPDLGPLKTVQFDTDEGTYTSVDVSPDGKMIAFDMIGIT